MSFRVTGPGQGVLVPERAVARIETLEALDAMLGSLPDGDVLSGLQQRHVEMLRDAVVRLAGVAQSHGTRVPDRLPDMAGALQDSHAGNACSWRMMTRVLARFDADGPEHRLGVGTRCWLTHYAGRTAALPARGARPRDEAGLGVSASSGRRTPGEEQAAWADLSDALWRIGGAVWTGAFARWCEVNPAVRALQAPSWGHVLGISARWTGGMAPLRVRHMAVAARQDAARVDGAAATVPDGPRARLRTLARRFEAVAKDLEAFGDGSPASAEGLWPHADSGAFAVYLFQDVLAALDGCFAEGSSWTGKERLGGVLQLPGLLEAAGIKKFPAAEEPVPTQLGSLTPAPWFLPPQLATDAEPEPAFAEQPKGRKARRRQQPRPAPQAAVDVAAGTMREALDRALALDPKAMTSIQRHAFMHRFGPALSFQLTRLMRAYDGGRDALADFAPFFDAVDDAGSAQRLAAIFGLELVPGLAERPQEALCAIGLWLAHARPKARRPIFARRGSLAVTELKAGSDGWRLFATNGGVLVRLCADLGDHASREYAKQVHQRLPEA